MNIKADQSQTEYHLLRCSRCGINRIIATGYTALAMTMEKRAYIAAQIGWQTEPVVLCPECVEPDIIP
jgi:hypothetical protein